MLKLINFFNILKMAYANIHIFSPIPLSDALIAAISLKNNMMIFFFDQHFKTIDGIKLFDYNF